MRLLLAFIFAATAAIAGGTLFLRGSLAGAGDKNTSTTDYVTLDRSLKTFVSDFKEAAGSVRMVFVVGPSCGPCLRALDDMNRVLGDRTRESSDLKAFVLYVPTLSAEERHAARAVRLMKGPNIRHYWDPQGESGRVIQEALGIDVYAWDVWLVYDRNATWTVEKPPAPAYWEHQLWGVPSDNHLQPEHFAEHVAALLAEE